MDNEFSASYEAFLAERRAELLSRIAEAAARVGRSADEVEVLAVSKTVGPEEVVLAWQAGYRRFGENRPQELTRKRTALAQVEGLPEIPFDMIGNLQKNKINQVLGNVRLIHSVSSPHLAEAISKRAEARGITAPVLLEVNVSGEGSKSGFVPHEVLAAAEDLVKLGGISVEGVMTMAPAHDADAARKTFSGLRELRDELRVVTGLPLDVLSCGMSDDFGIAVEEGSTLVRLGRIVFDQGYKLS